MEIPREKMDAMLAEVPEEKRDAFLADFKARGHTVGLAKSSSGQNIYPQQEEIGKGAAALEAVKQAAATPIPGLEQAGKAIAETIPGTIAVGARNLGNRVGADIGKIPGASGIGDTVGESIAQTGAVGAAAVGTAGEMIPRKLGDVALQAAAGPVIEGAGVLKKALTPAKELASKVGTALLARDIGVAEPFIENVKRNPAVLKDLSNDISVVMDHAKSLGDIMKRGVDRLGEHINAIEDHFIETHTGDQASLRRVPIRDVLDNFLGSIKKKGVEGIHDPISSVKSITGDEASLINKYVSRLKSISTSSGEVGVVSPGGDKTVNAIDLLRLKRELKNDIAWDKLESTAKKIGDQTNGMLKGLYGDVNKKIGSLSPELKQASAEYASARKQYDILQNKVFGGSPEEAYNRVKLRIQRGVAPQALIERAAQINSTSEKAMRALIDKVSAQQFEPLVRKGIAGGFLGVGAGAAMAGAMGGHGLYPLIADLAAAAISSPRMAAMGIRGEAAASQAVSKAVAEGAGMAGAHPNALRAIGQAIYNNNQNNSQGQ